MQKFEFLRQPLLGELAMSRKKKKKKEEKFPVTPMGVLATGSAHASPSVWPPVAMSGNWLAHFSGGRVNALEMNFENFSSKWVPLVCTMT